MKITHVSISQFFISFLLLFHAVVAVATSGHCSCGARARSASPSLGGASGRATVPVYHYGNRFYGQPHATTPASGSSWDDFWFGLGCALFGGVLFFYWRKLKGRFSKRFAHCTHRPEDHVLTWPERIQVLLLVYALAYVFSCKCLSYTALLWCTIAIVVYWKLDNDLVEDHS